ncbi:hypothetical protein [Wolbachia endosymbiont of Folsomia candida]|uniref:hypothetical protein n=1 Tax=Wolbachia endosymbiont of Folsomia candida TaxID=169402 RepID=UPI000A9D6A8F|nr:hypothetical protein [Wolbachia endosymbiont of Folsomia candida]APR97868.1 hypothetical protein ASM33_00805 [Wolbachia endosymbiont of Folsomia candida]
MAKDMYKRQDIIKQIISTFFRYPKSFKAVCSIFHDSQKRIIYFEGIKQVSDAIKKYKQSCKKDYHRFKYNYSQIKQISELLAWLENNTELKLFDEFYDFNHLVNIELPILDNEKMTNYLFNTGTSSQLFDLCENKEEALYRALCSDNIGLINRVFMVLTINLCKSTNNIIELHEILSNLCTKALSNAAQNYIREKLNCYDIFLHNNDAFTLLSEAEEVEKNDKLSLNAKNKRKQAIVSLIKSFASQPQELDKLTLTIIAANIKILGLTTSHELSAAFMSMDDVLNMEDQLYWLKQMLKIAKRENELHAKTYENEIRKFTADMKLADFKKVRERMVSQLNEFAKALYKI